MGRGKNTPDITLKMSRSRCITLWAHRHTAFCSKSESWLYQVSNIEGKESSELWMHEWSQNRPRKGQFCKPLFFWVNVKGSSFNTMFQGLYEIGNVFFIYFFQIHYFIHTSRLPSCIVSALVPRNSVVGFFQVGQFELDFSLLRLLFLQWAKTKIRKGNWGKLEMLYIVPEIQGFVKYYLEHISDLKTI